MEAKRPKMMVVAPTTASHAPAMTFADLLGTAVSPEDFIASNWEKQWLHVDRMATASPSKASALKSLFTLDDLLRIVDEVPCFYSKDINFVEFKGGVKTNLNEEYEDAYRYKCTSSKQQSQASSSECHGCDTHVVGRVSADAIQAALSHGISIQFHQPQRFMHALQALVADMERFFGCLVGANVYITPPNSQGLAPHHDDIEAFVLQTQGQKHWKLYAPVELLAGSYSTDLSYDDIGAPVATPVLKEGDLLYFSRGQVHEARTADALSIHITISTYQRWSFGAFLQQALPICIEEALPSIPSLRAGLPLDLLRHNGTAFQENAACLAQKIRDLLTTDVLEKLLTMGIPRAVDAFSMDFMTSRLPPQSVMAARRGDNGQASDATDRQVRGSSANSDEKEEDKKEEEAEQGFSFSLESKVALIDDTAARIIEIPEDEESLVDLDPDLYYLFVHSCCNRTTTHMTGGGSEDHADSEDKEEDEGEGEEGGDEDEEGEGEGPVAKSAGIQKDGRGTSGEDDLEISEGGDQMLPIPKQSLPVFKTLLAAFPAPVSVASLVEACAAHIQSEHGSRDGDGADDGDDDSVRYMDPQIATLGFLQLLHDVGLLSSSANSA